MPPCGPSTPDLRLGSRGPPLAFVGAVERHTASGGQGFPDHAAKYVLNLAHEIWDNQPLSIAMMAGSLNEGPQAGE
jgi:hypothetical protein